MARLHSGWLVIRGACLIVFYIFIVGFIFEIDRELPP
jgi:hypothetical protein